MARYAKKDLLNIIARINRITKSPATPYNYVDGKPVPNAGCFMLDGAYGGYALHRMSKNGGASDVLQVGHVPPKELANLMFAFIRGLEIAGL